MPQLIDAGPEIGLVEFPDEASDDLINRELRKESMRIEQQKAGSRAETAGRVANAIGDVSNVVQGAVDAPGAILGELGRSLSSAGKLGAAVASDAGGYLGRGEIPLIDRPLEMPNTAALLQGQPLPSDVADEALARQSQGSEKIAPLIRLGARDAVRSLPAVAAGTALTAAGVPAPLAFGGTMAAQTYGETGSVPEAARSGVVGAIIPGAAGAARELAGKGLAELVKGGVLNADSALTQKAIETLSSQAAAQGVIEAAKIPQYAAMNKEERRAAIVRSVAANLAFGAMELPQFRAGVPSGTAAALGRDAEYIVSEMLTRAPLELADPNAAVAFASDPANAAVFAVKPPAAEVPEGAVISGQPAGAAVAPPAAAAQPVAPEDQAKAALLKRQGVWEASTPREGNRVKGIWTVADAGDLVSSSNKGFDANLQPRDRTRAASSEQIAEIVRGFEPERLGDAPTTDLGAPIIDERNQVLSGNGRVAALRQVYGAENGSKAEAYRAFILKQAEAMGSPPEVIESIQKMKQPVLVRQVSDLGGISKEQFARESNQQQVLGMGEAEQAASNAKVLASGGLMDLFRPSEEGDLLAASNRDFLKAFVKGTGDEAALMTKEGFNGAALNRRVKNAVLARVLGVDRSIPESRGAADALIERVDELNLRNVANGLMSAAPGLAKLEGTPYDLAPVLSKAVADLVRVKSSGGKLEDFLGQRELLADPARNGDTDFLLEQMARAKTARGVAEPLVKYAERAGKIDTGTKDIFGGDAPRRGELLQEVFATANGAKGAEQPELGTKAPPAAAAGKSDSESRKSEKSYKVFQGRGKTPEEIYGKENVERGAGVPLFGKGEYYAFSRKNAEAYGKVTPHTVRLRNPYLLDSDAKWFALLKDANAPHLNNMAKEHYTEPEKIPAATERVQQLLKSRGYDGIEVRLAKGSEETRRLSAMVGHEQVVRFAEAKGESGGGAVAASIEQSTLPRRIESETTGPAIGEPVSLAEIRQYLSKALDIPVRFRRFGQRALGIFKVKPETIRLKAINDVATLAHEVGHYLHWLLFPKGGTLLAGNVRPEASDFAREFDAELLPLGKRTSRASYTQTEVRQEGVAEFVREWLTDRTQALAKAPNFTQFFEGEMAKRAPEIWTILQKAQTDIRRYIQQPAMVKLQSRINLKPEVERRTLKEFWQDQTDNWVNELAPIQRALKQLEEFGLPPQQAKAAHDYAVNYIGGWRGKVEYGLRQRQIDLDGNDVGPSLREVLGGIEDLNEFRTYLVGMRELELGARGIKTGLDAQDAAEQARELGALKAKYQKKAEGLYEWQRHNLKLLLDAGLITPKAFVKMTGANELYVPFYRIMENLRGAGGGGAKKGEGFINLGQGVYKLKGSDRQYVDPLESVVKNAYLFRDLAERNRVAKAFVDAVELVRGGGRVGESVTKKLQPIRLRGEEIERDIREALLQAGIELPDMGLGPIKEIQQLALTVWRAARQQSNSKEGVFTVWDHGEQRSFQISDEHLYRALSLADSNDAAIFSKVPLLPLLRGFTRLKRAGATLTLEFIARNPFRDQVTAGVFSKHGFLPFVDGFRGMISAVAKDKLYWDWVKSGGRYSDFIAMDRKDLQSTLADVVKEPSARAFALSLANPLNVVKNLQKFSELMEQATRLSEHRRALEAGANEVEAANASKDVTLNFARAGFKGKLVNQLVAFFNAGIQDLSKFARAHQEDPVGTSMRAFMYIGLPSILAWWLGRDDERMQKLPEWRRSYFWNVNLGELARRAGYQAGDWVLSLPKPFLLGQIYGTSFERGLDWAYSKDPNAVKKWFMATLQATPLTLDNLLPSAATPLVENYANKSFFRGTPLENEAMKSLPPEMRYGPQTSLVARKLGELSAWAGMGLSPIKIDNLIQGWFAGLGKYGTEATDFLAAKMGVMDVPEQPTKTIWERPLFRAFHGSPYEASAFVERFYKGVEGAEERIAGVKRAASLGELGKQNFSEPDKQSLVFYLAPVNGKPMISQLRDGREKLGEVIKAMGAVQASRNLSGDQKREKLLTLAHVRDELSEAMFKTLVSPEDRARVY